MREKTFVSFVAIRESFFYENWGCSVHWGTSEQLTSVFSVKIIFSANL